MKKLVSILLSVLVLLSAFSMLSTTAFAATSTSGSFKYNAYPYEVEGDTLTTQLELWDQKVAAGTMVDATPYIVSSFKTYTTILYNSLYYKIVGGYIDFKADFPDRTTNFTFDFWGSFENCVFLGSKDNGATWYLIGDARNLTLSLANIKMPTKGNADTLEQCKKNIEWLLIGNPEKKIQLRVYGLDTSSQLVNNINFAYTAMTGSDTSADLPTTVPSGYVVPEEYIMDSLEDTRYFTDKEPVTDYAYSFAVIGDTQATVEQDVNNKTNKLSKLYDWILENKDEKKMEYVFGMGDITQNNTTAEWEHAQKQIVRLDGQIPYLLNRGNHDGVHEKEFTSFNKYISSDSYRKQFETGGYYDESNIDNTWITFSVGNIDYLVLALEFGIPDDVIAWANGVISSHPNHNVIITTHAFLSPDGDPITSQDSWPPSVYDSKFNNGDEIWEKLVSKHKNIVMVLCGHDSSEKIVMTQTKGDYGNTVTQILVDPDALEHAEGATGLVAMLYFSEDGKNVQVEYYSTVHEMYFTRESQFSFNLDVVSKKEDNYLCAGPYKCWLSEDYLSDEELAAQQVLWDAAPKGDKLSDKITSANLVSSSYNYGTFWLTLRKDTNVANQLVFELDLPDDTTKFELLPGWGVYRNCTITASKDGGNTWYMVGRILDELSAGSTVFSSSQLTDEEIANAYAFLLANNPEKKLLLRFHADSPSCARGKVQICNIGYRTYNNTVETYTTPKAYTGDTSDPSFDAAIAEDYPLDLTHTVVTDAAVEPTYTSTGLTEGSHCSSCGEVFVAQQIIPAKEYVLGDADGNKGLDILDLIAMQKSFLENAEYSVVVDMNKDSIFNALDILGLKKILWERF